MGSIVPLRKTPDNTVPLHSKAFADLAFIRETMARSGAFTAVPGWGMVAMGFVAMLGSFIASNRSSMDGWIYSWFGVACLGCTVGVVGSMVKASKNQVPLWAGPGRRFVLSFLPAIFAGCVVTEFLYERFLFDLMPPLWLMLYGVGVTSAGVYSVKAIPVLGMLFMAYSVVVFYIPLPPFDTMGGLFFNADAWLALGFGGLHIAFGLIIALKYGG